MKINRQILTARALQNIQIKTAPQRAVDPVEKSTKIRSWKEIFDAQLNVNPMRKFRLKAITFLSLIFNFLFLASLLIWLV